MNRPLLLAVVRHEDGKLVLQSGAVEVVLEGNEVGLAEQVLELCDGTRMSDDILSQWPGEREDILELLKKLKQLGVVADCTQAFRFFHRASSNGENPFFEPRTDEEIAAITAAPRWEPSNAGKVLETPDSGLELARLLAQRSSAYPEDSGTKLTLQSLSGIVRATYGFTESGHRTVPSGGALYPLVIHVAAHGQIDGLNRGLWWFNVETGMLQSVNPAKQDVFTIMLNAEPTDELLSQGQVVIFISADLDRSAQKYGNRAYRYVLLEAGAAMQNAMLAAAELGVKMRPIGGFLDRETQEFLELSEEVVPLLTIITGG
ncbi:MAG: SagB/ThcOx family dehydrogenase [Patescibacteria group bacterium]